MLMVAQNLKSIREQIMQVERNYNKEAGSVTLVGITKKQPLGKLKTVAEEGLKHFGELHLQEALSKLSRLKQYELQWHFLESIQLNKAAVIAQYFNWVHSVDRAKTALTLNEHRPEHLEPLNILIEVNVGDDANRSGAAFEEVQMIADFIAELPRLQLRGLSGTPAICHEFEKQREPFKRLRDAFEKLKQNGHPDLDTLCMGKSHDFTAAIAEGATMVRLGAVIFGENGI